MLRRALLIAALAVATAGSAAAQDLSLEQILQRHYEALGGLQRLKGVQTRRMTGRLSMPSQGIEATFTMLSKRPGKTRMDFTLQGVTGTQAFDGENGWMFMPFAGQTTPERMPADMAREMRESADFDGPLVDYAEKGNTVELVDKETVEGSPAYKLKVTDKGGQVSYYYLDAEYFLPLVQEATRTIQGMEINSRTVLGDYKEVDGMMMPFSIQVTTGPTVQSLTVDKIEFNVEIPDDQFTMPAGGGAGGGR